MLMANCAAWVLLALSCACQLACIVADDSNSQPVAKYHGNTEPGPLELGKAVAGSGHTDYWVDVGGTALDGVKMLVQLTTGPVRNGSRPQIVEIKPYRRMCEHCDPCLCIGCGELCTCQCNRKCNERCTGPKCSCYQTVAPLFPGRWYITVDVDQPFHVEASLVSSTRLVFDKKAFGLVASSDPYRTSFFSSEGMAWANYYYVDAEAHMSTSLEITHTRSGVGSDGSKRSWLEVYMKAGAWPTTYDFDSQSVSKDHPYQKVVLPDMNLLTERLYVVVYGKGDAWTEFSIRPIKEVNWMLIIGGSALTLFSVSVFVHCVNSNRKRRNQAGENRPLTKTTEAEEQAEGE